MKTKILEILNKLKQGIQYKNAHYEFLNKCEIRDNQLIPGAKIIYIAQAFHTID